jgi:hypothetical protein
MGHRGAATRVAVKIEQDATERKTMPRMSTTTTLEKMISELRDKRAAHQSAIAEIDAVFARLGINADGGLVRRKPGRPAKAAAIPSVKSPGPGKRGRRRRGSFAKSGEQEVLDFIKSGNKPNSAEINAHWSKQGRGGRADNAISKLVKEKKIKRVEAKGERGSRYVAA